MRSLIRTGPSKDSLTLSLDLNHPAPTATDYPSSYLIQTRACALTRGELTWPEPMEPAIPVPGFDFAGEVLSVPSNLPHPPKFKAGDHVFGMTYPFSEKGSARDITTVDEREICLVPSGLTFEDAAAIPLSALTAWQALFVHGKLAPPKADGSAAEENQGKRVLVTAASGGVGIWAVQLAALAGVTVVGTCGHRNVEYVLGLGAHAVLDYAKIDLLEWVADKVDATTKGLHFQKGREVDTGQFDVVVDCIGGATLPQAWQSLKSSGIIMGIAEPPEPKEPTEGLADGVTGVWFIVEAEAEQLKKISALVESGECRGEIDEVFELEDWEKAFQRLEGGHARGKVVLKL